MASSSHSLWASLDFQVRRLGRFGINEEASKENIGGYFGGLRRSLHAADKKVASMAPFDCGHESSLELVHGVVLAPSFEGGVAGEVLLVIIAQVGARLRINKVGLQQNDIFLRNY